MQRLGSPAAFPALPGASTQLWKCQTRYRHRTKWWKPKRWGPRVRDKFPTFEISDLLLDLDADGAKGVRAFDPQLDGEPESRMDLRVREMRPLKERIAEYERGYQKCLASFRTISANKFHPLHISDFDIIAATFVDSPNGVQTAANSPSDANDPTTHAGMLGSVLDANGIPRTIRDHTSDTTTYMRHRRDHSGSLCQGPGDSALFSVAFSKCTTFPEIDRSVARIIRTPEGCQTLSRLGDELHTSLTGLVPQVEPIRLLSFLNDMLINFDRHGLHMSSKLLDLGLWASLKCQAIATAQQYIERGLKFGFPDESTIDSILDQLLQTSIASTQFSSHEFQSNPTSRLTTLFSLLTGYIPGEDGQSVALRSLISHTKVNSYRMYIQCLARLGAYRTIWHEWHATDSASQVSGSNTKLDSSFGETRYFVTAMLEALSRNGDMNTLARSPEFAKATGQLREDYQLDLIAISRSAKILASPGREQGTHQSTPARVRQWETLYQIFSEKQIQKAFPALQAFLIQTNSFS